MYFSFEYLLFLITFDNLQSACVHFLAVAYKAYITNNKNTSDGVESNGSSDMPETEWPSHARKITKLTQGYIQFIFL